MKINSSLNSLPPVTRIAALAIDEQPHLLLVPLREEQRAVRITNLAGHAAKAGLAIARAIPPAPSVRRARVRACVGAPHRAARARPAIVALARAVNASAIARTSVRAKATSTIWPAPALSTGAGAVHANAMPRTGRGTSWLRAERARPPGQTETRPITAGGWTGRPRLTRGQ